MSEPKKRLAKTAGPALEKTEKSEKKGIIKVVDYTDKSIVVNGDTIEHSDALVQLGGKFNPNLKIGAGWIFAKIKKESVENYINTGEIIPHVYSKEEQNQFKNKIMAVSTQPNYDKTKIIELLMEMRNAFEKDSMYEGTDIIDVIDLLEHKYIR